MKTASIIKILFTIHCFAALSFFQPLNFIMPEVAKAVSYVSMAAIFTISILCDNDDRLKHKAQFASPLKMLIVFIALSTLMPTLSYFDQEFSETIVCTLPYFSYGLYFALRKFDIGIGFFIKLILTIVVLAIITHLINLYTFPIISFGKPEDEYEYDRGGIRLIIQGFNFIILAFFIAAAKLKQGKGKQWWIVLIICYAMILASYTRQHILACTLLAIWIALQSIKGLFSRFIIAATIAAATLYIVPQIPMFKQLIDITIEQHDRNESANKENVRILAAQYYGWQGFENISNRLFGNGVPSFHSKWGMDFKAHSDMENIYAADVGWFGFNWYFGIFAVLCMLTICIKAISKQNRYSDAGRYYFIWLLGTSIMNGALLYQYEIIVTVIAMCIADCENEHHKTTELIKSKTPKQNTFWATLYDWRKVRREREIANR